MEQLSTIHRKIKVICPSTIVQVNGNTPWRRSGVKNVVKIVLPRADGVTLPTILWLEFVLYKIKNADFVALEFSCTEKKLDYYISK